MFIKRSLFLILFLTAGLLNSASADTAPASSIATAVASKYAPLLTKLKGFAAISAEPCATSQTASASTTCFVLTFATKANVIDVNAVLPHGLQLDGIPVRMDWLPYQPWDHDLNGIDLTEGLRPHKETDSSTAGRYRSFFQQFDGFGHFEINPSGDGIEFLYGDFGTPSCQLDPIERIFTAVHFAGQDCDATIKVNGISIHFEPVVRYGGGVSVGN